MRTINISIPHSIPWDRHFPDGKFKWGDWRFLINAVDEDYDYLVAYDNLHTSFKCRCPRANTLHIASEPPTVRHYDELFLSQFAWIITQDPSRRHPRPIYNQPGLPWFVGWNPSEPLCPNERTYLDFKDLEGIFDHPKTKLISVISSDKAFTEGHRKRLAFAQRLKAHYGDQVYFFGRGHHPFDDKLDVLKDYRFHIVIENSEIDHYFSEKLTDSFLAGSYPLYHGCPNLGDYFPENAYQPIDIDDFEGSLERIDTAINQSIDVQYRDDLRKAQQQSLYEHNVIPMLVRTIEAIEASAFGPAHPPQNFGKNLIPFHDRHKKRYRLKMRFLGLLNRFDV